MSEDLRKSHRDHEADAYWYDLLSGEDKGLRGLQPFLSKLPAPPRCKLCGAPFHGPYSPILNVLGFRRWPLNQMMCRFCVRSLSKHRGGAEVPVSLLFSDVRGSTTLAEQMAPSDFSDSLNVFFATVFDAVDSESGIIDHIVGDGVMAMWVPGFVGRNHPERALAAGRKLAADLAESPVLDDSFRAGVGVHTGEAYVGVVGEPGSLEFTVLGDTANTAARLGSAGQGGELVISDEIAATASLDTSSLERRVLELKGKAEPVHAWVEQVPARA